MDYRDRDRDRSYGGEPRDSRDSYRSRSRSPRRSDYQSKYRGRSPRGRSPRGRMSRFSGESQQDRRVYVGNLAYGVKWPQLKDFAAQAGEVLHADVLLLPNGRSKGCGIVEYASRAGAEAAVETLNNQDLLGRLVFVREDRESAPKFGAGERGSAAPGGYGAGRSGAPGGAGSRFVSNSAAAPGTQLFVSNLPYSVSWQDLKDLFRDAGDVVRADVLTGYDGRSKGVGVVVFSSADDAKNAIAKFNGYDFQGRAIEVREDRYASTLEDKNSDFTRGTSANGEPSSKIYVDNLPWATVNTDLVELFQTVGDVVQAEIKILPNGRPQGAGVVELATPQLAEEAIAKFNGYNYGNRDLVISFAKYGN